MKISNRCFFSVVVAILMGASELSFAAVKNPDTFTYLTIGDVDSFDPAWSYDTASHLIIANVYEYLFGFKNGNLKELEPILALKVPSKKNGLISNDGLIIEIPIRQGVKFHDGTPMTAADVEYSLLRFMLYDRDAGPSALLLEPILGVNSVRDTGKPIEGIYQRAREAVRVKGNSVVIRLHRPFAPLLALLSNFSPVVSKSWCAKNGQWDGSGETWLAHSNPRKESSYLYNHMNGTGPFMLERWDNKIREIVLARYESYWRPAAKLKHVIIKQVDEFNTRKVMLAAGDADSIYAPQMMFSQVENMPGVELIDGLSNLETTPVAFFTFNINTQANPNVGSGKLDGNGIPADFFSDPDIRKALAYSIDYEGYSRDILRGKGSRAAGFIPQGLTGYNPKSPRYEYNPEKAKEHLKKAWGGKAWEKGFSFAIVSNTGSEPARIVGQMMKKTIEAMGPKFKVDVRLIQWSTYLEQTQNRKIPVFIGAWIADFPDAHNFAYPFMHSSAHYPQSQGYNSEKATQLVERGVAEQDPAKRQKIYEDLVKLAYEDVPHVVVADGFRYRTQRSWVKGWTFNPIFPDAPYGDYYYPIYKSE